MLEFSTDGVPPRDRLPQYREGLKQAYFDLDVRPLSSEPLEGRIRTYGVSTLHVGTIAGTPQTVLRARQSLRGSEFDGYFLNVQLRGRGVIEQCERRAELTPGQAVFVHGAEAFRFHFPDGFKQISLHIPYDFIPAALRAPTSLAGVKLPTEGVLSRMLLAAVGAVVEEEDEIGADDALAVEEQLIGLLHACFARTSTQVSAREIEAEARVMAWIERHLCDPLLDLEAAARGVGLSCRSIQYVFQRRGESFSQHVRRRRVERAQVLLRDPSMRDVPIVDIAFRVGFSDVGTFCRGFRRVSGETASAYRRVDE